MSVAQVRRNRRDRRRPGQLADNPYRLGKPLRDDFAGSYGAPRGSYRVLSDIEDDNHAVRVHRITARAAYRRR
jgi:mRNA-degrading endonuclease RelE of RelBE toxin-antitoxin system